jgi:uncharacterized protein (TIGR02594 family)
MSPWVKEATKFVGLKEIKGDVDAPEIVKMWADIKNSGIKDDETPWCAAFVGACLERVGIKSTRSGSSQSFLDWGEVLFKPIKDCIVVFKRPGGGHVGFVTGVDKFGHIMVLGGNQSDAVNIKPFKTDRVVGYRWPVGVPKPVDGKLTLAKSDGKVSTNEA